MQLIYQSELFVINFAYPHPHPPGCLSWYPHPYQSTELSSISAIPGYLPINHRPRNLPKKDLHVYHKLSRVIVLIWFSYAFFAIPKTFEIFTYFHSKIILYFKIIIVQGPAKRVCTLFWKKKSPKWLFFDVFFEIFFEIFFEFWILRKRFWVSFCTDWEQKCFFSFKCFLRRYIRIFRFSMNIVRAHTTMHVIY